MAAVHVRDSLPADGGESERAEGAARQQPPLRNRASSSKSPFVRGAQDSLVKWQLLDWESLDRAEKENKLIFLHIGYRACHFSRVMALESFSNPECAALLNRHFIPVIVDREECPDIDTIYMNYVQAINGDGGWPLNVFLTPALGPVFGGTRWFGPSTTRRAGADPENGAPDFLTILQRMRRVWTDQEVKCRLEATDVVSQLRQFAAEGTLGTRQIEVQAGLIPSGWAVLALAPASAAVTSNRNAPLSTELDLDQLEEAYTYMKTMFDSVNGGFGTAPKFVTPPRLAFLLHLHRHPTPVQDVVGQADCRRAAELTLFTLRKIRDGALHDHVGGAGFSRCSVTPDWSIPNFEKLVVDNALLLGLYLDAWLFSGGRADSEFFDVVEELVDYLTSAPIARPDGCLVSSEAADSYYRRGDADMREGAYYVWTRREFDSVLDAADRRISPVAAAYWDVREDGNVREDYDLSDEFVNQNILRVVKQPAELAAQFDLPLATVEQYIQVAKRALRGRRERERVRPDLDDKVVTSFNGLAISALARAGAALRAVAPHAAQRCLDTASAAVGFIERNLWDGEARLLYRIWNEGRATEGLADDYAYLILGLLDLFEAAGDEKLVEFADMLQKVQNGLFHDHDGGFYSTTASSPHAILRLKDGMDTSLPSTNAVSAGNLARLGALLDDCYFAGQARGTVNAFEAELLEHPGLFPGLLGALVMARLGVAAGGRRVVAYREARI
ncbi:hypothetical protein CDD83_10759 [Cordyceps sp. RAO-2017]|nr:hypothetical protein CDD83_10759 [Cordyceps sp. RAO-2017]